MADGVIYDLDRTAKIDWADWDSINTATSRTIHLQNIHAVYSTRPYTCRDRVGDTMSKRNSSFNSKWDLNCTNGALSDDLNNGPVLRRNWTQRFVYLREARKYFIERQEKRGRLRKRAQGRRQSVGMIGNERGLTGVWGGGGSEKRGEVTHY